MLYSIVKMVGQPNAGIQRVCKIGQCIWCRLLFLGNTCARKRMASTGSLGSTGVLAELRVYLEQQGVLHRRTTGSCRCQHWYT